MLVRVQQKRKIDMIRNLNTTVCFAILIFLNSCDYVYNYTYEVTNSTDGEINIELKTQSIDSVYSVSKDEKKVLFITDHGVEGSKGPYFEDVSFDLKIFTVTKSDTLKSTRNYLSNSSWTYNNGLYRTTITLEEFK